MQTDQQQLTHEQYIQLIAEPVEKLQPEFENQGSEGVDKQLQLLWDAYLEYACMLARRACGEECQCNGQIKFNKLNEVVKQLKLDFAKYPGSYIHQNHALFITRLKEDVRRLANEYKERVKNDKLKAKEDKGKEKERLNSLASLKAPTIEDSNGAMVVDSTVGSSSVAAIKAPAKAARAAKAVDVAKPAVPASSKAALANKPISKKSSGVLIPVTVNLPLHVIVDGLKNLQL